MHWWDAVVYRFVKYVELTNAFEQAFRSYNLDKARELVDRMRFDDRSALCQRLGSILTDMEKDVSRLIGKKARHQALLAMPGATSSTTNISCQ